MEFLNLYESVPNSLHSGQAAMTSSYSFLTLGVNLKGSELCSYENVFCVQMKELQM